ncbi:MAG: alkaline phosphatase family protein [Dehalococcoidia bacterium]
MVALDALDVRWLKRWAAEGRLPNLARFMERCDHVSVSSDGATLHGSVWPTFALGAGPGEHGVYWWLQWLSEEARYVRNNHPAFAYEPFWDAVIGAGKRVVVVDVPYTPAVRGRGVWTANGWGLHDEMQPVSYPDPFLQALRRRYGDHPLRADTLQPTENPGRLKMAERLRRGVAMRARMVCDFAGRRDWDLFITTFAETHKAGHYLAEPAKLGPGKTNEDALVAMLEPLDTVWPEIVRRAGDDCEIILFALHGMEPQVDYAQGVADQLLAVLNGRPPESGVRAPDLLRRLRDVLPAGLQDAIWLALPSGVRSRRFSTAHAREIESATWFAVAHDGSIALRAAVEGREGGGCIAAEEVPRLLDAVEARVAGAVADDGQEAFGTLLRLAERFAGPRAGRLPDGLLLLNPAVMRTSAVQGRDFVLRNVAQEARNGVHTGTGFCYVHPGNGGVVRRDEVDSRDFAPTVLSRLDVRPPRNLYGEVFVI